MTLTAGSFIVFTVGLLIIAGGMALFLASKRISVKMLSIGIVLGMVVAGILLLVFMLTGSPA